MSFKPPNSLTFSSILCLNYGGLFPHKNLWTCFSKKNYDGQFWAGKRQQCVILDSIRILNRVILPYGVRFLGSQRAIILSISIYFFSMFISVISFIPLTLKVIPSDSNSDVHISSLLLYDLILLSLNPINLSNFCFFHVYP